MKPKLCLWREKSNILNDIFQNLSVICHSLFVYFKIRIKPSKYEPRKKEPAIF